jgi:hypothetical protein
MYKILLFWLPLLAIFASWELVLFQPTSILYWLGICLLSSAVFAWYISRGETQVVRATIDRFSFAVLSVGVFWWLLWIDYKVIKYVFPVIIFALLVYFVFDLRNSEGEVSPRMRLAIFFGGTFFWATISFGLITVLGWQLWHALGLFVISFALLSYSATELLTGASIQHTKAWLVLVLFSAEIFSVIVWLPFTETTLALILTIISLFAYDMLKYFVQPELIRRKIIVKKILVYSVFLIFILASTPWY